MGEAVAANGPAPDVVGREAERARIDAFVGGVPQGPGALIISGAAGIGKTTLWRYAVWRARRAGFHVSVARPAEEEMPLALGSLVDLFEDEADGGMGLLAEPDPIARGRSVLAALRRRAEAAPVVLAVDDLQWIDSASAHALRHALRRIEGAPVAVVATVRAGPNPTDPLALARVIDPGRFVTSDVGPLSMEELRGVLGTTVSAISRPVLRRICEVSGGNPLYAIELARGLSGAGRSSSPPGRKMPLPESLQAAIVGRLEAVPDQLTSILQAISAMGSTSVADLRAFFADVDVDPLLAAANRAGLLQMEEDLQVRFAHPLLASAVYDRMSPLVRRSLHARLAERSNDPDVRARHVALSTDEPDASLATLLEDAAGRAGRRGAPDVAAELAGHSVTLTPRDDAEGIRRRTLSEIRYRAAAGEVSRALAVADGLIGRLPPGPGRAEALVQRAQLEDEDLETGEALLLRALDDAGPDRMLRGQVLDQLGWLRGVFRGDLRTGIAYAREALAVADEMGDRDFQMSAAAGLSNMETIAGTPRPDLMARAVALEDEIGRPLLWSGPRVLLAEQLLWAGDLAGARELLEQADAHAVRVGNERWRPYGLYDLAAVECAAGNLAMAERLVGQAMELARDSEDAHVESWIFYRLALIAAWLGRAADARAAAERRLEEATRRGERTGIVRVRSVLGLLALSEGAADTAAGELGEAARLLDEMGIGNPGVIPALPDAVEALAGSGDVSSAEVLLARLEAQAEALGNPLARALAERAGGVLLLARGQVEGACGAFESAAAEFDRLGFRPEAMRAVLGLGRALLRRGHRTAAAEALADARRRCAEIGAVLWETRVVEELERAAPGRSSGQLTPAERRVAALVADGMKNRQIGQALFMSVATVEAHLTRIYRKLDIGSRSELTRMVAEGRVGVAADGTAGSP
jgi:DNA-binding CsgD family transcriptional regulator/tetratricopeptide (TPR) repeat protein